MRTFEVSDVAFKDEEADPQRCARNERHVTAIYADRSANFEIVHGLLDRIMRALDVPRINKADASKTKGYYLATSTSPTFFPGRAATIHYRAPMPVTTSTQDAKVAPPVLDSTVKSNTTATTIDDTTETSKPQADAKGERVTDTLSTTVDAMGKALADILGGNNQSSLLRKLKSAGDKGGGDIEIGQIGVLHPEVLSAFELDLPCSAMEFDLEVFL
jgi:phenylalanyl-tRNA synthetase beta chain